MVMMTGLAMTREQERGTMENLLAMPSAPLEVMLGKIAPYIFVGYVQVRSSSWRRICCSRADHRLGAAAAGRSVFFIAANLAVGFTFSTSRRARCRRCSSPSSTSCPRCCSRLHVPVPRHAGWAQWIGEVLPLTHFLRIIRGIMLKGNLAFEVWPNLWRCRFNAGAMALAMLRYRRTVA
jgi:ABC-2 type transport system permease protein